MGGDRRLRRKDRVANGGAALNIKDSSGYSNKYPVSVAGGASITNGATINGVSNTCQSPTCKQNQGACAANVDPYGGVTMPSMPGSCTNGTATNFTHSNSGLQTLNPGVWCNGVSFTNDAQIKLNPGVYYVKGGNFNVGGNVVMNGTGVTIVLTGSASDGYSPPYANVTIGNGAHVNLAAPTSGATSGIAFFNATNTASATIAGAVLPPQLNTLTATPAPTQFCGCPTATGIANAGAPTAGSCASLATCASGFRPGLYV